MKTLAPQPMPADPVMPALQQQLAAYQRLAKLAQTQHECVRTGQTEQLLNVLADRQTALDDIAMYERILQDAKGNWQLYLDGLNAQQRQSAEELFAQTRTLLEQIVSGDKDDALILQQQKLNVGRQLGATQSQQSVNRRYAASAYGRPQARLDVQR